MTQSQTCGERKIQLERVNRGEAVSVNEDMAIEEALAEQTLR